MISNVDTPIAILSFNRPEYLRLVLESLNAQEGHAVGRRKIMLFQDGAVNPFSGVRYTAQSTIDECIAVFKGFIPNGEVFAASDNLGIALNFARAEEHVFITLGSNCAVFLEDDLILGKQYLSSLDKLLAMARENDKIGYVAAYGAHKLSLDEQMQDVSGLSLMGHNWAFGMTQRQWLKQRPYVDQYLNLVRNCDYKKRNHIAIAQLFHSWGLGAPGTSQDIAKSHACILVGSSKVNTRACFGKYIGAVGSHFTEEIYNAMGFANVKNVTNVDFTPIMPADALLAQYLAIARNSAMVNVVKIENEPVVESDKARAVSNEVVRLINCGDFSGALKLAKQGQEVFGQCADKYGHPLFLKLALKSALELRDYTQAIALKLEMSSVVPATDPCIQIVFARHYDSIGNTAAALQFWREAQILRPADPEINKRINLG